MLLPVGKVLPGFMCELAKEKNGQNFEFGSRRYTVYGSGVEIGDGLFVAYFVDNTQLKRQAGENLSGLIFTTGGSFTWAPKTQAVSSATLKKSVFPCTVLGFGTLPLEGAQLPVLWNGAPLCRITGKGSVFYRREDADTSQAEDACIASRTPLRRRWSI